MQPLVVPVALTCNNVHNDTKQTVQRPLAKFPSTNWGDRFLNYTPLDEVTKGQKEQEARELQHLVQEELLAVVKDPKERLVFIDAIQRLGVAYHFEQEIEAILQKLHNNLYNDDCYKDDLHYVSLHFRLLRQHGFYVPSDVFNKFKDENGSFKDYLTSELQGILNLWWRKLDFAKKLPYARDRLVVAYFWTVAVQDEPKYTSFRILYAKLLKMVSVLDDTYDAYGTIEELEAFTEAIQRWDKSYIGELPDYMKLVYETLLDIIQQLEQDLEREERSYAVKYLQQEFKDLCSAYMQEAKWCSAKYVPAYDEYIRNGIASSTYLCLVAAAYQGMEIANKDAYEWLHRKPKTVTASCIVGRVLNDLASHKFEEGRNHVATAIQCYVTQFGVSKEAACEKLQEVVEEAWKDATEDMFRPNAVPLPLLIPGLNLGRISHEMYKLDLDGYTDTKISQAKIVAVLIDNYAML